MLEELRQTPEMEAARAQIRAMLEAGPAPAGNEFGRNAGEEPKAEYVKGFAQDLFLGRNHTRAFLGSYHGEWRVVDIDRVKDEALVEFVVMNDSGAQSGTRLAPPYGYRSDGSQRSVLPNNPFGANAPLGTITERFEWTETIRFGPRAARP